MRYLLMMLSIFVFAYDIKADELACQHQQLSAAAKLCSSLLQCEADSLLVSDTDGYNLCVNRARSAFTQAYKKSLNINKVCWLAKPSATVLDDWQAKINGSVVTLNDTEQSLQQLIRYGVSNQPTAITLQAELLNQSAITCKAVLNAYAAYTRHLNADVLVGQLKQAKNNWLSQSQQAITNAEHQGLDYQGKSSATIYERIALLAEQQVQATAINSDKPQPTNIGAANGEVVTAVIGPKGGSIASRLDKIKLTIPEGALSTQTEMSIQAITNHIPGSNSRAYRFKPDGLKFAKPVQVTLTYEPEQTPPDTMGLGYQDEQGFWHGLTQSPKINDSEKTVSFLISHFSDWGFYEQWRIYPARAHLKPGEAKEFSVFYEGCSEASGDDCLLTPLVGNADVKSWSVNGIPGGSKAVGTIKAQNGAGKQAVAYYQAPLSAPSQNPVSVTALIDTHKPKRGQLQLISPVFITPNWSGYIHYEYSGQRDYGSGNEIDNNKSTVSAMFPVMAKIVEIGNQVVLQLDKPDVIYEASTYQRGSCSQYEEYRYGITADDESYANFPIPALELHIELSNDQAHKIVYTPTVLANIELEWEEKTTCKPRSHQKGSEILANQVLISNVAAGSFSQLIGKTAANGRLQGSAIIAADEQGKAVLTWDLEAR